MLKSNEKQINDSLEWKLYLFDKLVKGEHKIHSSMYNGQTKKLLNCLNKKKKNYELVVGIWVWERDDEDGKFCSDYVL